MNIARALFVSVIVILAGCGPRTPEGPPAEAAGPFEGAWRGTLTIAGQSLRMELVLETGEAGAEGVLISLDQAGARIALTTLVIEGETIRFAANPPGLSYEGVLDGDVITGAFSQSVITTDLVFERGRFSADDPASAADTTDLSDEERAVTVQNGPVTLSGTLRTPDDALAGVVLLSGSGAQDRDGTFGAIKVYEALADALAARGVASLRLDDRTVGASTGPSPDAPSDLAGDASAAISALADLTALSCTGFAGHSEGGLIALLAAPEANPDFIVSLAGMHMSMEQTLLDQAEAMMRAAGGSDAQVAANQRLQDAAFAVLRQAEPGDDVREAMEAALVEAGAPAPLAAQQAAAFGQPYAVASFQLDPAAAAAAYEGPVLGVFAQFDLQVLPGPQSAALRQARGSLPTELVVLEGVNHLFQETETGLMAEYGSETHPVSQRALDAIAMRTADLARRACEG